MYLSLSVVAICSAVGLPEVSVADKPPIRVPPNFEVTHVADDDVAHDIHSLTFDANGQLVVSGPGYIRTLIDLDGDGKADRFKTFAEAPISGAQGMYFMGPHLLASGDAGLQIFRDDNNDGKADREPQTVLNIKAGGEHHVHAIQRGPDGWWYIIAGNLAEVTGSYATLPTSPIKDPKAGVLMRLKPDLSGGEIVSDGLRNAYDFAFSEMGDVFTFDSDGERDVSLPWYLPCRVFHVTPGFHAGWVSRSWKRPNKFPDMPRTIASFGRGSPTGVVCYRHDQFPSRYNGAIFVLDWTFGRILAVSMNEERGFWKANSAIFAKGDGNFGFAPTDMEVAPDGSLYVSVGGRGSRGGVYRISYVGDSRTTKPRKPGKTDSEKLNYVLNAPQAGTSWSRSNWFPVAKELGENAFATAAADEGRPPIQRMRAIEILTDVFGGVDPATVRVLTSARSARVRARAVWSIGRSRPDSPNASALATFLSDTEPLVIRFAMEALTTVTDRELLDKCLPRIAVNLRSTDSAVRSSASKVVRRLSDDQRQQLNLLIDSNIHGQLAMALGHVERTDELNIQGLKIAAAAISDTDAGVDTKYEALRLLQLSLGDVGPKKNLPGMFESYRARGDISKLELQLNPIRVLLAKEYPSQHRAYNHELIRCISILGSVNRDLVARLLSEITDKSHPADDIHRLAALTRIEADRTVQQSEQTAAALTNLEVKVKQQKLKIDSNWEDRVRELYDEICRTDPAVPGLIAEQSNFGLPGHVLFLKNIPASRTQTAIDGFARTIQNSQGYEWTNDVVFVVGRSQKPTHKAIVHSQLNNPAVLDAVLIVLSRSPQPVDRGAFLAGLNSPTMNAAEACVKALTNLPRNNDAAEQYTLLATANRLKFSDRQFQLRENVVRLLQNNMLQSFGFVFGKAGYGAQEEAFAKWKSYLAKRYPDFKPQIEGGQSAQQVLSVLHEVQWDQGSPERGQALFAKLTCSRCHGGRKALGPDLQGVGKRFNRKDLFAAIVDPNRDVPERYQLTTVITTDGKTYSGLIVYESVDGILLRDTQHRTYRIEAEDIETKVKKRVSLMPSGLLRNMVDQDLADLDAYLRRI